MQRLRWHNRLARRTYRQYLHRSWSGMGNAEVVSSNLTRSSDFFPLGKKKIAFVIFLCFGRFFFLNYRMSFIKKKFWFHLGRTLLLTAFLTSILATWRSFVSCIFSCLPTIQTKNVTLVSASFFDSADQPSVRLAWGWKGVRGGGREAN